MEYCGFELTDEGLRHYGIQGMRWGIRRYQPYPGGGMTRRHARKAVKSINKNIASTARINFNIREANQRWLRDKAAPKLNRAIEKGDKKKEEKWRKKIDKVLNSKQLKMSAHWIKKGKENVDLAIRDLEKNGYGVELTRRMTYMGPRDGMNVYREIPRLKLKRR